MIFSLGVSYPSNLKRQDFLFFQLFKVLPLSQLSGHLCSLTFRPWAGNQVLVKCRLAWAFPSLGNFPGWLPPSPDQSLVSAGLFDMLPRMVPAPFPGKALQQTPWATSLHISSFPQRKPGWSVSSSYKPPQNTSSTFDPCFL